MEDCTRDYPTVYYKQSPGTPGFETKGGLLFSFLSAALFVCIYSLSLMSVLKELYLWFKGLGECFSIELLVYSSKYCAWKKKVQTLYLPHNSEIIPLLIQKKASVRLTKVCMPISGECVF